jgi:Tfp pilus assembly protein PilV
MKINRNKTARNDKQDQRGFTLVETCISMVVMMVAGLAVSSLFVFSLQNNVGGGDRALAMGVAQQQLERLRSVAYEDTTLALETNNDNSSKQLKRITIVVTPTEGAPAWTRSAVTLVSLRSSLASGSYAIQ